MKTKLDHEKELLRQRIDAHRTLMKLEFALARVRLQQRTGRVGSLVSTGKKAAALAGGGLVAWKIARLFKRSRRREEAPEPASRWHLAIRTITAVSGLLGAIRGFTKSRGHGRWRG